MDGPSKIQRQKKTAYTLIGAGLLLLLITNTLAWIYLRQVRGFFVTDLAFRLQNIAQISAKLIDPTDLGYIIPDDLSDPTVIYYQQLLMEIKDNNNLQDIYILSPAKEILVEIPGDFGGAFTRHDIENDLFQEALGGRSATSSLQSLGNHKFMSALAPITDANNMIAGIIVVEAPANFFDVLGRFNNGLILFGSLTFFVILVVAYLIWYAFRRLILIQQKMQDQAHLVKLGEMAASVAHEIRNPLSIIKGTNDLIEKKYGNDQDDFFKYIPAELTRLNKLIEDFLSFARVREPAPVVVDLHNMVAKVLLGFSSDPAVSIRVDIAQGIGQFRTDPEMLEQILLNVITNSRQAVKDQGVIRISATANGETLMITIEDNGPGIPEENMPKIFDPFFSTKDSGSGLGLAISRRLAEQLNGSLHVTSVAAQGTTVTLELPYDRVPA